MQVTRCPAWSGRPSPPDADAERTTVDADRAHALGLLTHLTDDDEDVLPRATELATTLANGPTICFAQIKQQLRQEGGFTEALEAEARAQAACGYTEDHVAAVDAFVNKRPPGLQGKVTSPPLPGPNLSPRRRHTPAWTTRLRTEI